MVGFWGRAQMGNSVASADDEEAPLLSPALSARDPTTLEGARRLNIVTTGAICFTVIAVLVLFHVSGEQGGSAAGRIEDLKMRLAQAEMQLAAQGDPVSRACIDGACAKDFLPPISRENPSMVAEVEGNVIPASLSILLDPEQSYWLWVCGGTAFVSLLLLTGALLHTGKPKPDEGWFKWKARQVFAHVRNADTFKQLTFYDPYNDPAQEPGEGNAYRLIAIVGPDFRHITRKGRKADGEDLTHGGFEFTVPTKSAYFIMLCVTACLLTMQVYFPWQLMVEVFGKGAHFKLVGLKKVAYYTNFPERVWLQLVPLVLMSCKFFVMVERVLRSEFNQCYWLYNATHEGKFKYQCFGKLWSHAWITISLLVNFWIGIVMTLYVVTSIATFDTRHGDLMDFILGIFGSLGLINFDDSLMEALPLWAGWYKQHCLLAGHPQGEHPDGEPADEFFGPEGVKGTGLGKDVIRWGQESQPDGPKQARGKAIFERPVKTKFVRVGIQLTPERHTLGFMYSGNKITMVSDSGAAAWAVDVDELRNGVQRHVDLLLTVAPNKRTLEDIGLVMNDRPRAMIVKEATGDAFAAGVRPGCKLVEVGDEHVKGAEGLKKVMAKLEKGKGCLLRFHMKSTIWDPFWKKDEVPPQPLQPLGDGDRGPYLYKQANAEEQAYWEYDGPKMAEVDRLDGNILPKVHWPPTTDGLRMLWQAAVRKWKHGCYPLQTIKTTKRGSFSDSFGLVIDRDPLDYIRIINIVPGTAAETQLKFPKDEACRAGGTMYVCAVYRISRKGRRALMWQGGEGGCIHEMYTRFSKIRMGDEVECDIRNTRYLRKPKFTGLERGMQIWKINGESVQTQGDIAHALRKLRGDSLNAACDYVGGEAPVPWTGGTVTSRDENGKLLSEDPSKGVYKEFTMTLTRAAVCDGFFDDLVHACMYAVVRILLLGSLIFILATYYVDVNNGRHVGI
eukprot:TRINITY_DN543_c0_g1_i1.p1 TRINITY_DN543_c0_g1~~TRINITY_DN543_c0_g1_i1.p1  ORF type:complete len:992 (+),score=327.23 TRINITY_DN543_c0_g1_i1:112-2976(+)